MVSYLQIWPDIVSLFECNDELQFVDIHIAISRLQRSGKNILRQNTISQTIGVIGQFLLPIGIGIVAIVVHLC